MSSETSEYKQDYGCAVCTHREELCRYSCIFTPFNSTRLAPTRVHKLGRLLLPLKRHARSRLMAPTTVKQKREEADSRVVYSEPTTPKRDYRKVLQYHPTTEETFPRVSPVVNGYYVWAILKKTGFPFTIPEIAAALHVTGSSVHAKLREMQMRRNVLITMRGVGFYKQKQFELNAKGKRLEYTLTSYYRKKTIILIKTCPVCGTRFTYVKRRKIGKFLVWNGKRIVYCSSECLAAASKVHNRINYHLHKPRKGRKRKYLQDNKERVAKYQREYRAVHKESLSVYYADYHKTHYDPKKRHEKYIENIEALRTKQREYRNRNKDRLEANRRARRARQKLAPKERVWPPALRAFMEVKNEFRRMAEIPNREF